MAGLGVLTLSGFSVGYGEALIFVAALVYALHIVGLGAWSQPQEVLGMSIVQLLVITALCFVCTAPNGITLPATPADWASVLYMAVIAGAGAMIGQTWAQAHLPPTRAAIIMAMEPVFAALFAVLLGGESATLRMVVGGLLVLSAMLMAELAPRLTASVEVPHLVV
jgi:drug/metabolite transporter (DMT)-like permease